MLNEFFSDFESKSINTSGSIGKDGNPPIPCPEIKKSGVFSSAGKLIWKILEAHGKNRAEHAMKYRTYL